MEGARRGIGACDDLHSRSGLSYVLGGGRNGNEAKNERSERVEQVRHLISSTTAE